MNTKILIIGGTLILIGILILGYFLLRQKKENSKETTTSFTELAPLISNKKTFFPVLSSNELATLFFNNQDQPAFYKFLLKTKGSEKISQNLDTPHNVLWSPDQTKIILKIFYNKYIFEKYNSQFISPGTQDQALTTWLYDFKTQKLTQLDSNIQGIIWLPNSNKIIYQFYDDINKINSLNIADPNGQNWQKIINLTEDRLYGFGGFADNQTLIYFSNPNDVSGTNIYSTNIQTKQTKQLTEHISKTALVSPGGKKIVYELFQEEIQNYTLAIMNINGDNKKDLKIKTMLQKIIWTPDGENLITAIRETNNKTDSFYKINIQTGDKQEINYKSKISINAQNLILAQDEKTLYFTSDDFLYKLDLP